MLVFNPRRMFSRRMVERPHSELVKNGFAKSSATNLLNYDNRRLMIEHVEKLCLMLNCTPNDLFEWRGRKSETLPENHALNALKRDDKAENMTEMIKNIPVEKLAQVGELLRSLQTEE